MKVRLLYFAVLRDITGKSEWIIRGGGGVFYDRSQGNSVFDLLRNPPTTLEPVFNNGRLQDINPNSVLLAPPGLVAYEHSGKIPTTYAFNLGVQIKLPHRTLTAWTRELPDGKLEEYQVAPEE